MNKVDQKDQNNTAVPIKTRWEIVYYKRQGLTGTEVSRLVGRPISTCNAIFRKWMETGDVEDKPRSGRPSKVTPEAEEMIIEETKTNPFFSINQIFEETETDISKTTGWRTLKDNGFSCRSSKMKWHINDDQRKERLRWAKRYIKLPQEYWFSVIFTDESMIQRNPKKKHYWVSDEMEVPYTEVDRWQVSVLLWGAISYEGKCVLEIVDGTLKSEGYLNILQRRLIRNFPALVPENVKGKGSKPLIFQQDGASIHTTSMINEYFEKRGIKVLPWPAKSPDLNLIESVWGELKNKLKSSYEDRAELEEDIMRAWNSVETKSIVKLYCSMKERIQAVIDVEGGPTDY